MIDSNFYGERYIDSKNFARSYDRLAFRSRRPSNESAIEKEIDYWICRGVFQPQLYEHTPLEFERDSKEMREARWQNIEVSFPVCWPDNWRKRYNLRFDVSHWQAHEREKSQSPMESALQELPEFFCTHDTCAHPASDYSARRPLFHYWHIHLFDALRRENSKIVSQRDTNKTLIFPDDQAENRYSVCSSLIIRFQDQFDALSRFVTRAVFLENDGRTSQLIADAVAFSKVDQWKDFLVMLCRLWECYTKERRLKLASYVRNDIVFVSDVLSLAFGFDYSGQSAMVGTNGSRRLADDSLLDWVMEGDLYLARRDAIVMLQHSISSFNRSSQNVQLNCEDATQLIDFALENDCSLLIHALAWQLSNDQETLGRRYYVSEAIRPLREVAISIETLLDILINIVSTPHRPRSVESYRDLSGKLKWSFSRCDDRHYWWAEYANQVQSVNAGDLDTKVDRVISHLANLPSGQSSIGRAFATTIFIRNLTVHTARNSRAIFDAAASSIYSDLNHALLYVWLWGKRYAQQQTLNQATSAIIP